MRHTSIGTSFTKVQRQEAILQVLKGGVCYFLYVFGAGFLLGLIRTLWMVPRIGTRSAELLEMPIMAAVIFLAARRVCLSLSVPLRFPHRLGIGVVALGFLLLAEFAFVRWLQGMTIAEYVAGRDPVAGSVYVVILGVFAVPPLLVGGPLDRSIPVPLFPENSNTHRIALGECRSVARVMGLPNSL